MRRILSSMLKAGALIAVLVFCASLFGGELKPNADKVEAGPYHVVGLNSGTCIFTSIAFAGQGAVDALIGCQNLESQGQVQNFIRCVRGSDTNQDGVSDCLTAEDVLKFDEDGIIDVTPADYAVVDLDANQVHRTMRFFIIAFVDDDTPVRFTTDGGTFLVNGIEQGEDYFCENASQDPDCDGDTATVGDGVVVAPILIDERVDPGTYTAIAIQEGVGFPIDFTVVGPPREIELTHLFGKDTIQTGGTNPTGVLNAPSNLDRPLDSACNFAGSVAGVLGANSNPYKSIVVAKAFDKDGNEVSGALIAWTFPYDNGGNPLFDESDIGGVALRQTPTIDTGALGIGFPQFVCSKDEAGILELTATLDPLPGSAIDPDEEQKIKINVVDPPSSLTLAAAPAAIPCDGVTSSVVTATLARPDGGVPANGVDVTWRVDALGTASPLIGDATAGTTTTNVTPLSGAQAGVAVRASVGEPTMMAYVVADDDGEDNDNDSLDGVVNVDEEGELDFREVPNPDFLQASTLVSCLEGGAPQQPVPGQPAPPTGGAGPGAAPRPIGGPDTGSGGIAGESAGMPVWPAVALFIGAMGLIGARFALKRQ